MLVTAWAPMFAVTLGISRDQMIDLSVPEMVDHLEYWAKLTEGGPGGE